ncbi:TPA: hypothetical protein N2D99_002143 [Clostridium botulinum]|nr:hypothetical protein [Clostridium botulinum]
MVVDISKIIESNNIIKDIFKIQAERNIEESKYSTYFCRYVGLIDEASYNNSLALLDKKLKEKGNYLLFTHSIPMPYNQDLVISIMNELIKVNVNNLQNEDIILLENNEANERLKKAFDKIIPIAIKNEKFQNENVALNFVTKLMIWVNEYVNSIKWTVEDTPKCIFYGSIKRHEVYFLMILALIGFDVLYINASEDNLFNDIDMGKLSYSVVNPLRTSIIDYNERISKGIVAESVTTIGKKATKEIEKELFSDGTGMFKPWQFIDGNTKAITINSTLEEILIYWTEPSKLRPGFKVEGDCVIVPNFLAKVSGVNSDINEYHKFVNKLRKSKYTLFHEGVDLSYAKYSNQELYSLGFCLYGNGDLNYDEIKKHKLYKFKSLRPNLQEFILNKIDETLRSKIMYIEEINTEDRLRCLMTVLTIDDRLLTLIENFDFTGYVPKLVLYINDRSNFDRDNVLLLAFLNRIGFDIVVFTPCGASNIENHITGGVINYYRLEEVAFELELKEVADKKKSFFQKLFGE